MLDINNCAHQCYMLDINNCRKLLDYVTAISKENCLHTHICLFKYMVTCSYRITLRSDSVQMSFIMN